MMDTSDPAELKHRHPYAGITAVLATMHGKERVIAPAFEDVLGMRIVVPPGIDTDALGTFTGEVPRDGTMLEVAIRKARIGMKIAGHSIGIASEGTFARHPPYQGSRVDAGWPDSCASGCRRVSDQA